MRTIPWLIMAASYWLPHGVHAQPPRVGSGCASETVRGLEGAIELEWGLVESPVDRWFRDSGGRVVATCTGLAVSVEISLQGCTETLDAPLEGDWARILAIGVVETVRACYEASEYAIREASTEPGGQQDASGDSSRAPPPSEVTADSTDVSSQPASGRSPRLVALAGAARLLGRGASARVRTGGEVQLLWWRGRFGLDTVAAVDGGRARVPLGRVRERVVSVGISASYRHPVGEAAYVWLGGSLWAGLSIWRPRASDASVQVFDARFAWFAPAVAVGGALVRGRWLFPMQVRAGWTVTDSSGLSDADTVMRARGPWVSISVGVGAFVGAMAD